ncbi:MAG: NifB/NifX family molybdenum-iron cluster-binding protein [Candidatus Zixiibacteriota bacterium]
MKFAITSNGKEKESTLDPRFGRARYFIIYDSEKSEIVDFLDNAAKSSGHGVGIRTSQVIIDNGIHGIVTGAVGPNAFGVLNQAGIKMYSNSGRKLVKEIIDDIEDKNLQEINTVGKAHKGL